MPGNFHLTILGSSSATPTSNRNPSAQYLNFIDRNILIDCGEGTQSQIRKYKLKLTKIEHIFISHLHGDHYFGLPGLLSSLHLLNQTHEVHLYCFKELKEILEQIFKYSDTFLRYRLVYHFLDSKRPEVIFEDDKIQVSSFPLKHRIACCGFVFREKSSLLSVKKDMIELYKLSPHDIVKIKNGEDFVDEDGNLVKNQHLTHAPNPLLSYAYCSDTVFDESLAEVLYNVSLLYHEATFCNDQKERAEVTFHSTAEQAAQIAKKAQVEQLLIGHFSSRYKDTSVFAQEAKAVFEKTFLAEEGKTFVL